MKLFIISLFSLYQNWISPDHSRLGRALFPQGFCKYTPSCSMYAKEAINKKGIIRGLIAGSWRILRCNPWSSGGPDPVN